MNGTLKILLGFSSIILLGLLFGLSPYGIGKLISTIGMYFLPTILAYCEDHKEKFRIFLYNLFFGWTVMIWFWLLFVTCRQERLDVRILTPSVKPDTWDTLKITIRNIRTPEIKSLELGFTGEFATRQVGTYSIIKGETETIEIPIQAKVGGCVPIKITITYQDGSGKSFTQIVEELIDVPVVE